MISRRLSREEFEIDPDRVSADEARAYLDAMNVRERNNHGRTQAWFDHCARIRANPGSNIVPRKPSSAP